jgi:hypothetical protein
MNIGVLKGRITSEPVVRSLASGSTLLSLEVTTRVDGGPALSAPVGWFDPPGSARFAEGDEVVVLGEVKRRFFRGAAGTQSRTEVVAIEVLPVTARRRVERLVGSVVQRLGGPAAAALRSS